MQDYNIIACQENFILLPGLGVLCCLSAVHKNNKLLPQISVIMVLGSMEDLVPKFSTKATE
jgi:hypothetical protein